MHIFDPDVRITELVGSNRHYIDESLPHLAKLLVNDPQQFLAAADLLLVATEVAERLDGIQKFAGNIIDLRRALVVPESAPMTTESV